MYEKNSEVIKLQVGQTFIRHDNSNHKTAVIDDDIQLFKQLICSGRNHSVGVS
jgi:hypothetical protein